MAHTPVVLNVYNMYWLNEYTSSVGIGVYHSGLEVYGREFAFGGHPFDFTGIFETEPKDIGELGEEFTFKETVPLGFTDFTEQDLNELIEILGKSYIGSSYHLIERNCNHFTDEFSKLLTGKTIPNWVNRLATICVRFPFIGACIPKEWLTPEGATFSKFDLSEWEEIESPSSETFPEFRTDDSEFTSRSYNGSHRDKDKEFDNESISLTQFLEDLKKRSPSNDSLTSQLDKLHLDSCEMKTNSESDHLFSNG